MSNSPKFRSQHEHSLDDKDRLTIPSRYRHRFAEGCTIVAGADPCLEIHPPAELEQLEEQSLAPLGRMSKDARRLRRRMYGNSDETALDSAGRIRISKELIAHAGLSGTCKLVGAGECIEIWHPKAWAIEIGEVSDDAEAANERAALFEQASKIQAETR